MDMNAAMSTELYEQKRLACYPCRDKKLRCTTVRGDVCDRCSSRGLACTRPVAKRKSEVAATGLARDHLSASHEVGPSAGSSPSRQKRARWTSHAVRTPLSSHDVRLGNDPTATSTEPPPRPPLRVSEGAESLARQSKSQDVLRPLDSAERLFSSILNEQRSCRGTFSFSSHLDTGTSLDPIKCGILSTREALHLFDRFMETFGKTLAYFDPRLCTFDYIQSQSQSLLSVLCYIMARTEPGYSSISQALDSHVRHSVYPAILSHGFRSVEIVQTLMMLAAFEPPTEDIREDCSWTLLSHATRVASEINLQDSLTCRDDPDATEDQRLRRRHAQRTWLNLWLHEFSLSQHTGRKSILAEQDLFDACKTWHLDPLAHYTDVALVSMVELRTIIKRNRHLYNLLPPGNELFYMRQCKDQLQAWSHSWSSVLPPLATMPRLELSQLYVSHAMVQLLGLVLHNQPPSEWMPNIILELYEACSTYLKAFPQRLPAERLAYCYNSMWVAASYQVIVAVRLARLASSFTFIDVSRLTQLCSRVLNCVSEAANMSYEGAAPHCYKKFLQGVLASQTEESTSVEVPPLSPALLDPAAQTLMQLSAGRRGSATPPPTSNIGSFDVDTLLGFDDLEFFAWAGASLAQTNDLSHSF